jgi:hypothetical protein
MHTLKEISTMLKEEEAERERKMMIRLSKVIKEADPNEVEGFIWDGPTLASLNEREVPSPRVTEESMWARTYTSSSADKEAKSHLAKSKRINKNNEGP